MSRETIVDYLGGRDLSQLVDPAFLREFDLSTPGQCAGTR